MYRVFLVVIAVIGILTGSPFMATGGYIDSPEDVKRVSAFMRTRILNHIDYIKDTKDGLEAGGSGLDLSLALPQITRNIKALEFLLGQLDGFRNLKDRSDHLFAAFLESRLRVLDNRNTSRKKAAQNPQLIHPSTYFREKTSLEEEIGAGMATDLHDMYTDCILALFPLLPLTKIKPQARRAIMMSPSLWEIFKRAWASDEVSIEEYLWPAQGIINIPGEGFLFFRHPGESPLPPKNLTLHPDLVLDSYEDPSLAANHLVIMSRTMETQWAGFHKFERLVNQTNFEIQERQREAGKSLRDPLIPPLDSFRRFLEFMGICESVSAQMDIVTPTRVEVFQKPSQLSVINSLTSLQDTRPLCVEYTETAGPGDSISPQSEVPRGVFLQPTQEVPAAESPASAALEQLIQPIARAQKAGAGCGEAASAGLTSLREEVDPGERLVLSPRQQTLVNKIFGVERFWEIQFEEFVGLWTSKPINGQVNPRSSGGSHHSIVFNGRVIGKTFAPHKTGHGKPCYGKRTIKSLREALEAIGIIARS